MALRQIIIAKPWIYSLKPCLPNGRKRNEN
jgi:hypothetical protein